MLRLRDMMIRSLLAATEYALGRREREELARRLLLARQKRELRDQLRALVGR